MQRTQNQSRVCLLLCIAPLLVDYSIPLADMHRRSGEQVFGTIAFDVLHWEKVTIRILGSASHDCFLFVHNGSFSSSFTCCAPSSTHGTVSPSCWATDFPKPSIRI
ncbi:hypothetical protein [Oryza sativa Japonica Group]|uniref:Secreted protein n=1 Tax=Oryza sativa subsp. japonica TaxID=39947 RepID=Q5QN24_ORYSJ|nr:hypothetical protein [Oryza sativa Japonica Group]